MCTCACSIVRPPFGSARTSRWLVSGVAAGGDEQETANAATAADSAAPRVRERVIRQFVVLIAPLTTAGGLTNVAIPNLGYTSLG